MKIFMSAVILCLVAASCRNTPVIPESPVISFSTDIQPIIASNCQVSGCHGSSTSGNEGRTRALVTYDDVISNGSIDAYNAHKSDLYERIINAPGSNVMPPSPYNQLSQQQLLNIYLWIMQGANNN